jgi:uracil-DNA glycosylase
VLREIEDLNVEVRKCKKCRLWKTRTNVICGEGNYEEGKLDKKWIELYCKGD